MSLNQNDIALAENLIRIIISASQSLKALKSDKPEVYAAIGQHHKDALAAAEAEAAKP